MQNGSGPLSYSLHARVAMAERVIPTEWIERTVSEYERRADDPNDLNLSVSSLAYRNGMVASLRVVVNTRVTPWKVVSVFFDRRMRRRL